MILNYYNNRSIYIFNSEKRTHILTLKINNMSGLIHTTIGIASTIIHNALNKHIIN
jgi:hypothetical protein